MGERRKLAHRLELVRSSWCVGGVTRERPSLGELSLKGMRAHNVRTSVDPSNLRLELSDVPKYRSISRLGLDHLTPSTAF